MINFTAFNPCRLHFGKGVVEELGASTVQLGSHALLLYGGGSVKRNGSYTDVRNQLKAKDIHITEYDGIRPNPRVEEAVEAVKLGRDAGVDIVVAVGGGSVIDSAKIIAVCISEGCDIWDLMSGKYKASTTLPLMAVLTLAATGTEMNGVAVLQNSVTKEKIGYRNELLYPNQSFLDPSYTISVPPNQTAYGIVDLVAHCLEAWFGEGDASLSDRFVVAIIQEAMKYGPLLMEDPGNFELRAKIMWAATNALNNTTMYARKSGDWGVHRLGHVLSFLYDTPHAATLSILYPAWLKAMEHRAKERIEALGKELFGSTDQNQIRQKLADFFTLLGCPLKCIEAGIDPSKKSEILHLLIQTKAEGLNYSLTDKEREEILDYCW